MKKLAFINHEKALKQLEAMTDRFIEENKEILYRAAADAVVYGIGTIKWNSDTHSIEHVPYNPFPEDK